MKPKQITNKCVYKATTELCVFKAFHNTNKMIILTTWVHCESIYSEELKQKDYNLCYLFFIRSS